MHTLSLQPTPCGAVTSSSQAHSRPVFIGRSPANQILAKSIAVGSLMPGSDASVSAVFNA